MVLIVLLLAQAVPERSTYKVGETIVFRVQIPGGGKAAYTIREDSRVPPLAQGTIDLKAELTATLDHPGFVLLEVKAGKETFLAAAAVEPDKIASVAKEPADFGAFWEGELTALKAIPINAQTTPRGKAIKVVLDQVEGRKVYGWVVIPEGKGPYPAILELPAYGSGALPPPAPMNGAIYATLSVHNSDLEAPAKDPYQPERTDDHRKNFFKYPVLGGVRMIDHLAALPQFDGKRLALTGKSQGGGLSIMVAGLDRRVTHLSAVVPAFGQHAGTRSGRSSGFPGWVWQKEKDGLKEQADLLLRETEYYEIAHFARRFKGSAHVMAGWIDTVCPPSSIMAAFNQFPGTREIVHGPAQDHDWNRNGKNWWPIRQEWLKKFAK
ncbi:MAG TPA: acetylxylan esterase [Planctomycetota bacterium]|nr:acetylxylan esterase [Planctomycetota bacterium]